MFLPKAAIFDLDGTLLDSMWCWRKIDADFLASRGHIVTPDYTDAIKCMGWDEGARYTIDRYGLSETPEEVINAWFDLSEEYYRNKIPMKPYAKEYLAFLHEHNVPMAIATSMEPKKNIDVVIDTNGLGVGPSECAVFEDILAAVRGAKAGGFQTVAIFDELSEADWPDMQKEATVAASSWKDLL